MSRRGPIVAIGGIVLIIVAFTIAYSVLPSMEPSIATGSVFSTIEGMFDYVSEETQIYTGDSHSFSFTTSTSEVPLMWGLHILDYQQGDRLSISVSNIFGDNLAGLETREPFVFEMFQIPKADTYSFVVENKGIRPVTVFMVFSEDPENSEAMLDPNSPFLKTLIPLAISGILLIIGIIVLMVGIILAVVDWRKGKSESRYI
ncbi:MAG: hypothetical protein ACE5JT_00150 [Nitrosopumilaceae archaeon]